MKSSVAVLIILLFSAVLFYVPAEAIAGKSESDYIVLKRATIDTSGQTMGFGLNSGGFGPSSTTALAPAEENGFYLIQFDGPVAPEWKQSLQSAGVKFFSYIPNFAFTAKFDPKILDVVRSSSHVKYVCPYSGDLKVDPALDTMVPINAGFKSMSAPLMMSGSYPMVELNVKVFDGENLKPVVKALEDMGCYVEVISDGDGLNRKFLYVEARADMVSAVAALPEVEWIEKYRYAELHNMYGKMEIKAADLIFPAISSVLPLNGAGQTVGVLDTGLDTGDKYTLHPAFFGSTAPGTSKLRSWRKIRGVSSFRLDGNWSDIVGHGSHVAGTAAGFDPLNPQLSGVAPGAQLYFQSVQAFGDYLLIPPVYDMFKDAARKKAYMHNNSWGSGSAAPGDYDNTCVQVDTFTWENPQFLPVFSAGNSGMDLAPDPLNHWSLGEGPDGFIDEGSITSPATSKNCLTVGAAENQSNGGCDTWGSYKFVNTSSVWPRDPIFSDSECDGDATDDLYGIAAFSSRGPTADYRIKPDLIAPGTLVQSVRSQIYPPPTPDSYNLWMSGTSMAAPFVTGSGALVREYLKEYYSLGKPSAALVKAILINGAHDITPGQYGDGRVNPNSDVWVEREVYARPDVNQGWGHVDVKNSLYPSENTPGRLMLFKDSGGRGIEPFGGVSIPVTIADTSIPVRITLVWTDYPSTAAAAFNLVNDLDMTVYTAEGGVYFGNEMFDIDPAARAPWNVPGDYDHVNNVEEVSYQPVIPGTIYVNIQGLNIPQPGSNGQPYALVVSGGLGGFNPDPLSDGFYTMAGVVVYRATKLPAPGATVRAVGPMMAETTTDGAGNFLFTGLIPGAYYLSAEGTLGETVIKQVKKKISNQNVTGVKINIQ